MKVTALIENTVGPGKADLRCELGLSLYVEHAGKKLLFDTGASAAFAENAARLGVDLAAVDAVVVSHHHYDHGGGLRRFMELNTRAPVYLRPRPQGACYFRLLGRNRPIGLDDALFREHAERFVFVAERSEILPGAVVLPRASRSYAQPPGNRFIFLGRDGQLVPDDFAHELILALREDDGVVAFTGCSHQGILNMIDAVSRAFPRTPIKAVFGGFHLVILPMFNFMAGSKREVREIATRMLEYPLGRVYTGHCTGSHAFRVLKGVMGEKLEYFGTGGTAAV